MTDPAAPIRALCDRVSDLIESTDPTSPIAQYGDATGGGGGRVKYPMTDALMDAREHLKAVLTSWALLIRDDYDAVIDCRDETTSIAAFIYRHADQLAHHDAAGEFITELEDALRPFIREADKRVDDRRFCGWHEGVPVYAKPGQTTVKLGGDIVDVETGRDDLRGQIMHLDLTVKECAAVLKQVCGMDVTAKSILRMYEKDKDARENGTLKEHEGLSPSGRAGDNPKAPLLFRVEEVETRAKKTRRFAA